MRRKAPAKAAEDWKSIVGAVLVIGLIVAAIAVPLTLFSFNKDNGDSFKFYGNKLYGPQSAFDFQLTDQDGNPFQLSKLHGQIVLLTFGFTHCANICPTTLGNLAAVYRKLPLECQSKVKVVFVSIDPARDTPKVLKDYVPFFNDHFIGLTGTDAEIALAAKGYGVFFQRSPDDVKKSDPSRAAAVASGQESKANHHHEDNTGKDYSMDHSAYTYLIDQEGRLSIMYRFEQMNDVQKLAGDIEHLLDRR